MVPDGVRTPLTEEAGERVVFSELQPLKITPMIKINANDKYTIFFKADLPFLLLCILNQLWHNARIFLF